MSRNLPTTKQSRLGLQEKQQVNHKFKSSKIPEVSITGQNPNCEE